MEYENTCKTAKVIRASPPALLRGVSWLTGVPDGARVKCPTRPAMMAHVASSKAPVSNDYPKKRYQSVAQQVAKCQCRTLRRPQVSIRYNAGIVPATETAPRMVWMTYGFSLGAGSVPVVLSRQGIDVLCTRALEECISVVVYGTVMLSNPICIINGYHSQ